jgi:succinate dehydrogenase / fumarate reductase iron-sulfur subunit
MRNFKNEDTIFVEPFRSESFPVIKDLVVDRTSFDRIIAAGGFVSVSTGSAPDANSIPVPKVISEKSMDAAACIGCGACVAACPNGSAMLFTAAKVSHLNQLPQGEAEASIRAFNMVTQMDAEGFGKCSNIGACEAECPKEISLSNIARLNREYLKAVFAGE